MYVCMYVCKYVFMYVSMYVIVSLKATTSPPNFFSTPFLSSSFFLKYFQPPIKDETPLQQKLSCNSPSSPNQTFSMTLLLIQLKTKRKIAGFRYFNTHCVNFYTLFPLKKLLIK